MQRFVCAALYLSCALLRAATGFPELPGFFTETTAGVYQSRGARLAVMAGPGAVRFGELTLKHKGGVFREPVSVDATGGIVNTYTSTRAATHRPAYRAVEYRDIYPGITLRLSFEGRAVKADYLVAPGADPRQIRFRYEGADARLETGELIVGEIRQPAPTVLQGSTELPSHYVIGRDGWVRFVITGRDRSKPMVIDPYVITRSAYFGGALVDRIAGVAVDTSGYLYVAGSTESTDFPVGSLRTRASGVEAFVLKLNPSDLQVMYATYLGGSAEDRAAAIVVDGSGSAYFTGFTASADFPGTLGPNGGSTDAFVARLTASGTLQFATFLGGSGSDIANGMALKADGSVWVVGETDSTNMTLYGIPYQAVNRGGFDAFLARVNGDGSIAYAGYFGGTGDDRALAVALDAAGEVHFTGGTASATQFPVANAFRSYAGMQDAFAAKLSADGGTLRYSTHLGGSGGSIGQPEVGNWIGIDATGAAIVVGITGSTDFPVTGSAVQPTFGGGATDGFVSKISVAGTSLLYSTYFGGTGTDEGWAGAISADGTFYFGGNTSSPGMLSVDGIQAQGGDIDGFFAKLSSNLSSLLTFSYLGYTGTDSLSAIALAPPSIVLAGSSSSPSWLSSGGFKGWYDGWVMTLSESGLSVQINSTPSGMAFTVSGSGCSPGPATAPATLGWSNGASCAVSFASTQGTGDTRRIFQSWSDGSLANPRTIVASNGASYTMQFTTEHRLTRTVAPAGAGTISGIDGFYSAGSNVNLSASANTGYQFTGWSGAVSTGTNPITVAMDAPKTVTANFNVVTTFNNPAPAALTVSGTGCAAGTYSTQATSLAWTPGATCSVSVPSMQVSGDTRWVFARWSDGSTANPRSFTAAAPMTYQIEWNAEYRLTRLVTPSATGTVNSADGFYASSSTVPLTATPASGYLFSGWTGDGTGTANPLFVVMNAPKSITANFVPRTSQVTIESNVSSLQFTVSGSGCNPGSYSAPQVFAWPEGGTCVVSISAIQGGDVRWVFEAWADGPTSNPRSITVGASAAAYTMQFGTQYKLTRSVTGQGSVTGADGFYAAGSSMQLTATAASGYQFTGWSGNVVSTANPLTFTMSSPSTITANFSAAPTTVAFGSNVAGQITVGGSGCPIGTYTVPANIVWTNGTTCNVTVTSPYGGPDTRWVFSHWSDGNTSSQEAITASPGATYTLVFTPEHKLVRTITGQGTVSGADGFYMAGSNLQLNAAAASGYSFTGWSGSASGTSNPLTLAMDGPKTVTANFTAGQAGVRIEANVGVPFSVTGSGCAAGTYTAPANLTWTTGSICTVTVVPPDLGPDSRWTFSKWADGPTGNARSITAAPGAVYSIVMAVEYRLTRSTSAGGSVSGGDGWYASGTALQLTATATAGYQFTGWSGAASGSANPLNVVMDGPKTVVATFAAIPSGVRIETNLPITFYVAGTGCPAGAYTAPATLTWTTGVTCEVSLQQPAPGADTKWMFLRWADGSTSNPRLLTANPGTVYTIVMSPEYRLTRLVSGAGSVSGADGFYPSGSSVSLTATPQSGQQLVAWSGSASGSANPLTVVMDGPKTVTAVFAGAPTPVRIETNVSAQINVSGSGCPAGTHTAPVTLTWASGIHCDISVPSPQGGAADSRWVFTRWADGSTANVRALLASAGAVYTLVLSAEHRLTRSVSGPGSVSGADGFYAAGSTVQLTANATTGYQFAGWTGSASGAANPLSLLMNGPKAVTASFTSAATNVRIEANAALVFSVTGANCPAGNYTAPATVTWSNGTVCSIGVPTPQGGPDTRLLFAGWTDGVTANPRGIAASPGAGYAFLAGAEHRLTRTVAGEGSVSGADGFYAAGSTVSLTATPAAGYQFAGWSGAAGGSANPLSIRIDSPTVVTANFTLIPIAPAAVDTLQPLVGSSPSGTFTATFSHGKGADELYLGYMLFLPTPNVVNYVATGSCLVEYNRISHGMRLIDDAGTGWLGPISGVVISPKAGTLSNSKCTVNVAGSSASRAGNVMTVTVPIVFKNGATPVMGTFLQALDVKGNWTGMTQFGNWTLSTGTPRPGPSIAGVANSTNVGSYAVYSITASHTSGASSLAMIHLLMSDSITKGEPCQVVYFPGNNTLNLINDTGSALVSANGVVPGTAGSIANSRCAVNTGLASQSVGPKTVTVTIPLNLQPATFGGEKKVYVNAFDNVGQLTHWVQAATLMVQ